MEYSDDFWTVEHLKKKKKIHRFYLTLLRRNFVRKKKTTFSPDWTFSACMLSISKEMANKKVMLFGTKLKLHIFHPQWNTDITTYQGTGEITSLYRGIVKPGFRSIHFTVTGIGRAEKC